MCIQGVIAKCGRAILALELLPMTSKNDDKVMQPSGNDGKQIDLPANGRPVRSRWRAMGALQDKHRSGQWPD